MQRTQILSRVGKFDELSRVPIIEMAGQNRVLIENHQGVLVYSVEEICVKVSFGCVCISGRELKLMHMSREQLVICGNVDGVQLMGGRP